jgi:chromosome segregation ATPase
MKSKVHNCLLSSLYELRAKKYLEIAGIEVLIRNSERQIEQMKKATTFAQDHKWSGYANDIARYSQITKDHSSNLEHLRPKLPSLKEELADIDEAILEMKRCPAIA